MENNGKNNKRKMISAIAGSVVLVGSSVAIAAPLMASSAAAPITSVANSQASDVKVSNPAGTFGYDQNATTSNKDISGVFNKGVASTCTGISDYGVDELDGTIEVGGDVPNSFSATVNDMADKTSSQTYVLACACATNVAGGGAIANAEVAGVTVEEVASLAGAV